MHIPTGTIDRDGEHYAIGVQIMAHHRREDLIREIGQQIEILTSSTHDSSQ
jgi:hypothetical protein